MKSPAPKTSGAAGTTPQRGVDQGAYASIAQTRELLSRSLAARNARLAAPDIVSTDEAARLVGTSRATIKAWIDNGRCIGLKQTKRGYRLPAWQFEPGLWEWIPQLAKALGTVDGWSLLNFLETPQGALGGRTPRAALEQGQGEQVLSIAAH